MSTCSGRSLTLFTSSDIRELPLKDKGSPFAPREAHSGGFQEAPASEAHPTLGLSNSSLQGHLRLAELTTEGGSQAPSPPTPWLPFPRCHRAPITSQKSLSLKSEGRVLHKSRTGLTWSRSLALRGSPLAQEVSALSHLQFCSRRGVGGGSGTLARRGGTHAVWAGKPMSRRGSRSAEELRPLSLLVTLA